MMWNIRRSKREESLDLTRRGAGSLMKGCLSGEIDNNTRSSGSSSTNSRLSTPSRPSISSSHSSVSCSSCRSENMSKNQCGLHEKSASSTANKKVRFLHVEVRDYERIVSDNPSCSSGPPIGIGWAHGEARVVDIETFEERRQGLREPLELILTRNERENLLSLWGTQPEVIARAIRANVKVKNQRRQTVRNLKKASIEENIEKITRRLKRALLMKRSTDKQVQRLQEQALLATKMLATISVPKGPREDIADEVLTCSDGIAEDPAEAIAIIDDEGEELSADDGRSTMSGLTLGNSTTASMREMEAFYRELELDLFGDEELPYMVGQTIEFAGVSDIKADLESCHDEMLDAKSRSDHSPMAARYCPQSESFGNMLPPTRVPPMSPLPPAIPDVYQPETNDGSFDYSANRCYSHPQECRYQQTPVRTSPEHQHYPCEGVAFPPGYVALPYQSNGFQPMPYGQTADNFILRSPWHSGAQDEPRVFHVPLQNYASPTRWMEGEDSQFQPRRVHCLEAVTIIEAVDDQYRSDWDRH